MDINGVIQTLNLPKSSRLRKQYRILFANTARDKTSRNWIVHRQEIYSSSKDWEKVWDTINIELRQSLLSELDRVMSKKDQDWDSEKLKNIVFSHRGM